MKLYVASVVALCLLGLSSANVLQGTIDAKRLQGILEEGLKSNDISTLYFSLKGLTLLNVTLPDVCEIIKDMKYDLNNIEQVFHLTQGAELSGCQNFVRPDVLGASVRVLDKEDAPLADIYHAVYAMKPYGKGSFFDREDALKNLIQTLKKDDSPINYGYVFAMCEHMGCQKWTATHAESVLLAADESDARALYFDGGLPATALLLTTIVRSYKTLNKPTPFTEEQRLKFGAYLYSRRSVTTPRGAALLLDAAKALADDEPTPISIAVKGRKYVTSEAESVEFSITDLLGRALPALRPDEVVAQSATRLADDVVVLSKQPLVQKPNEPDTYVLNLSKIRAQYGLYKITLSAGSKSANVNIAVLGEIQVGSVEVGVGDADGTTSPRLTTVAYPGRLPETLQADHLQKVTVKLAVRDKWSKPLLVQQAFVRVARGDHEAIFVAEPDNAKAYKVELNVGAIAKHLNGESGTYSLSVYLGDSAVSNPVAWELGNVAFSFGASAPSGSGVAEASARRGALPQIAHVFRSPEARPARALSDVFAAAAAAPLLLLLLLWARLRINLSGFVFTPSALVFHASLGGSLALYALLWLRLSMFETVRYLLPLAALAFLSGQRLLRRLVRNAPDKRH